jgi:hypothetical protein
VEALTEDELERRPDRIREDRVPDANGHESSPSSALSISAEDPRER